MTISNSEINLIKLFKNGDEKAFEKLFERHHKKLYGFLFKLLNSRQDTEEIVQDTFIKVWERREEFMEGYSFDAYLFKIAKNAFLNLNRKRVNRKIIESDLYFEKEKTSCDTEEYILFQETRDIINSIIEGLPPKRKEIFILRRIDGLSRKEIAEKLDISVITVDSQLLKANKYLKDELKKYSLLLVILSLS
ncbi:RNA polymerase sigma-70 factor [Prolixibacteraceae bacterium JC049]|nr:RNA polymerase sigma-70 factor [Prolixibacteraceae bacterium JC049]